MELTVAITGASGTIYAKRTLQLLAASGVVETVNLIMSGTAAVVAQVELGVNLRDADAAKINEWLDLAVDSKLIRYWRLDNLAAEYLGDPEQFWRICDANGVLRPDELTDTIGRRIRITLPDGIPGAPNA